MTPDNLRTELAVLEWTLKNWGAGKLTMLETGERITTRRVAAWKRRIAEIKRELAALE